MSSAPVSNQTFTVVQRPKGVPSDDVFKLEDAPAPKAAAGQIVARALYMSVDPYLRNRLDSIPVPGPMVSGQVGEVIESLNDKFKVGDKVFYYGSWSRVQVVDPSNAECQLTVVSPAVPLPAYLGVLGMPGATAFFGLKEAAQFKAGDIVLVSGAAGAVGSAVGQLARLWGAKKVIGTAGGPAKCKLVKEAFGFDECIDYKHFDSADKMKAELKRVAPDGIDLYYDNVGGFTSEAFYDNVRKFSRVAICGQISSYNAGEHPKITSPFGKIIYTSVNIRGFVVFDYLPRWREFLEAMGPLVKDKKIKYEETIVDGFEKLPSALRGLFEGANVGKMVVKI